MQTAPLAIWSVPPPVSAPVACCGPTPESETCATVPVQVIPGMMPLENRDAVETTEIGPMIPVE